MTTPTELDAVHHALRQVYDPELALDIVSLGLLYILRAEGNQVVVEMNFTTPGCPVSESHPDQAATAVADVVDPGSGARVDLRVVWDPPWTRACMDEHAASALGFV
jgi:metal-sulfur cluster biosynthetic enzyme